MRKVVIPLFELPSTATHFVLFEVHTDTGHKFEAKAFGNASDATRWLGVVLATRGNATGRAVVINGSLDSVRVGGVK